MFRTQLTSDEKGVFHKYSKLTLPRHTSYPVATQWTSLQSSDFPEAASFRAGLCDDPISIYVHVPFCRSLCFYCGCTREIVTDSERSKSDPSEFFLKMLIKEIEHVRARYADGCSIGQIHFGGGTPTFLAPANLGAIMKSIRQNFKVLPNAEVAIEVDPRVTTAEHFAFFADNGFNRISLGVQDFDPRVQSAVNRVQSFELVQKCVVASRRAGMKSVNLDLIYGLPAQTKETIRETIHRVIELEPDRVAYFRLAMIPEMFKWQKAFKTADLANSEEALEFFLVAISEFQNAGYIFIGLDHFAKSEDELSKAFQSGTLERNFQGMTTWRGKAMLGFGPSAISDAAHSYLQNEKTVESWSRMVSEGGSAWRRGIKLNRRDLFVRDLIKNIYCRGQVTKRQLDLFVREHRCPEQFERNLTQLHKDGLIVDIGKNEGIKITEPLGRLLTRVVASVFDEYLASGVLLSGSKRSSGL